MRRVSAGGIFPDGSDGAGLVVDIIVNVDDRIRKIMEV